MNRPERVFDFVRFSYDLDILSISTYISRIYRTVNVFLNCTSFFYGISQKAKNKHENNTQEK